MKSYGEHKDVQDLRERYRKLMTFKDRMEQAKDFCEKHGRAPRMNEEKDYYNWTRLLLQHGERQEVLELRRKYGKKKPISKGRETKQK